MSLSSTFKLNCYDKSDVLSDAYSCITWNIEGFARSKFSLKNFMDRLSPDFVFISEPMLFQCDLEDETLLFRGEYCSYLSSDDVFNKDIPLVTKRAKGGTMLMWKKELDAFITPLESPSSSFLPILFAPPSHLYLFT